MLTPLAKVLVAEAPSEGPTVEDFARWEDPDLRASDIRYFAHYGLDVDGEVDHTGQYIQYLAPKL